MNFFGSAPYSGQLSSIKPSCSKAELNRCTATEICWNKNEDARTSPVISTNHLQNSLKNWTQYYYYCYYDWLIYLYMHVCRVYNGKSWSQSLGNEPTNNNDNTRMIYLVLSHMAKPYARVHSGHLSESRLTPDGCQLVGQAANLMFESACRQTFAYWLWTWQ